MCSAKEWLSRHAHITNNFPGRNRCVLHTARTVLRISHFPSTATLPNNWFKSFASLTRDIQKLRFWPPLNQTLATKKVP